MMNGESGRRIAEAELHAWLDGRLEPERARRSRTGWPLTPARPSARELSARPRPAARNCTHRCSKKLLPARLLDALAQPAPPQPPACSGRGCGGDGRRLPAGAGIAGAFGGLVRTRASWRGLAGGGVAPTPPSSSARSTRTPSTCREVRHPVEVAAAESQHLFGWLSSAWATRSARPVWRRSASSCSAAGCCRAREAVRPRSSCTRTPMAGG